LAGELHTELAAEGEHTSLGGGVGYLGGGRAHHRDEGGGVYDRPAATLQQVRYAVLAAQKDTLEVHVLDPLPGVKLCIQDGVVVGRRDAGVVEERIYAAEAFRRLPVHPLNVVWVCDVGVDVEAVELASDLVARLVGEVHYRDAGVLLGEAPGSLSADAAGAAGDDRDLAFEPSWHH
jgi:hypothetical protein